MQTSYRWYRIRVHGRRVPAAGFVEKLLAHRADTTFHRVEEGASEQMMCVSRSEVWVERLDGLGGIVRDRIESISAIRFSIVEFREAIVLRVASPPRNIQPMMAALEMALGFGLSVKPIVVQLNGDSAVLRAADTKKLVSLKVTNVVIAHDCLARMEFASKEGLDPKQISALAGLTYRIEHVKYELALQTVKGNVSASAHGLVRIGGALSHFIRHLIEQDVFTQAVPEAAGKAV